MKIEIVNKSSFPLPEYETLGSSAMDLQADIDTSLTIKPLERLVVPTGIYMSIPKGHEGQVRARSGLALKHGITLANGIGTIDSDYRGEISVILVNLSNKDYIVNKGDRIAQLAIIKYEQADLLEVELLDKTKRGKGGFGHTGY